MRPEHTGTEHPDDNTKEIQSAVEMKGYTWR